MIAIIAPKGCSIYKGTKTENTNAIEERKM